MKHVVVAAMRNEGPFILEWVAWQKMLGFDDVLILYNDCTDHSPQMLQRLEKAGWITTQRHTPPENKPPKFWAHKKAREHDLVKSADWFFLCDVDEFLILHDGDGTVQGFLGNAQPDMSGIAIHWKCFGDSGLTQWQDELTHRMFTRAAPEKTPANTFFKSLVWQPRRFQKFGAHSPKGWRGEGLWNEGHNYWIRSNGQRMQGYDPDTNAKQRTAPQWVTHTNAQVNHYIIRTAENYEFKRGRKSASAFRDRYTDDFLERHNRNDEEDLSAHKYADRFDAIYAQIRAVEGIERLHHLCCADYIAEICAKRGDDPTSDPRWQAHMDRAAAAN